MAVSTALTSSLLLRLPGEDVLTENQDAKENCVETRVIRCFNIYGFFFNHYFHFSKRLWPPVCLICRCEEEKCRKASNLALRVCENCLIGHMLENSIEKRKKRFQENFHEDLT